MDLKLETMGLSEKESEIYRALLETGPSSVTQVTKIVDLNRTTGYDILRRLLHKGLVSVSEERGRQVYLPESPEKLVEYVEKQLKTWQKRLGEVKSFLPKLSELYQPTARHPKVKYFEGVEGLKAIYEDSLKADRMILACASVDDLKNILGAYAENYFRRRTKKKIFIRAILKSSDYAILLKRVQDKFMREVRLVPSHKFDFTLERYVYNNKVAYISFREKFGVIIESKEIAESEKALFELAWQAAEKYDIHEEERLSGGRVVPRT